MDLSAKDITQIYKKRWQIELVFYATEAELSAQILSGRQRERHYHTNLVHHAGQLAADDPQKPNSAEMSILEHGFNSEATPDKLYQPPWAYF
jgi:hypothetical protein